MNLNEAERSALLDVLGASCGHDLTFVTEEQLDSLPTLRAVTRGKLKALREETLVSGGSGAGRGGGKEGRRRRRRCGCF